MPSSIEQSYADARTAVDLLIDSLPLHDPRTLDSFTRVSVALKRLADSVEPNSVMATKIGAERARLRVMLGIDNPTLHIDDPIS